jgi:xylosylprotein 4-beta-galactosyltransferase
VAVYFGIVGLPETVPKRSGKHSAVDKPGSQISEKTEVSKPRLAVIVPFRNRFEELIEFAPYIRDFLDDKGIPNDIIVVNQVDSHRFNRAALINAGFLYATNTQDPPCDYFVMHDVDLLPLNFDLPYEYPEVGTVTHVAAPGLHPKYDYPSFIGGILIVTNEVFRLVNGMSNIYWGWGLEDDEFYVRLKQSKIQVKRPTGIETGKSHTFKHIHINKLNRVRDTAKCFDQWNKTRRRDRLTGLNTLKYNLQSVTQTKIEDAPIVLLNVELDCDIKISPWCDCNRSKRTTAHNSSIIESHLDKSNHHHKEKRRKT